MRSRPLTKAIREGIRNRVLEDKFQDELNALCEQRSKLALETYRDGFGKKGLEMLESIPHGWLPVQSYLHVEIGGEFVRMYFDGRFSGYYHYNLANSVPEDTQESWPMPTSKVHAALKVYDSSHRIAKKYHELENLHSELISKISDVALKVSTALSSFTTTKRLVEEWPEMAVYLPEFGLDAKTGSVPSKTIAELNRELGLGKAA